MRYCLFSRFEEYGLNGHVERSTWLFRSRLRSVSRRSNLFQFAFEPNNFAFETMDAIQNIVVRSIFEGIFKRLERVDRALKNVE